MRFATFLLLGLISTLHAQTSFSNVEPAPAVAPPVNVVKSAPPRAEPVARRAESVAGESKGNVVLRAGDSFVLWMSGMPPEDSGAFPKEYTIGQDGTINITYAGQIRAAGLSQGQLERAIEGRLIAEKYFRWPTATINVQAGARVVTVGGNVKAPQRIPWSPDLTLVSAISQAGGPGDFAGKRVNIIRNQQIMSFDYYKLKKKPADDPKLLPGDQVDFL